MKSETVMDRNSSSERVEMRAQDKDWAALSSAGNVGCEPTPTDKNPFLSVVVTARNDNHGGNLLARMQIFISGLLQQCVRHGVKMELILVEWNPPSDRIRLAQALMWEFEESEIEVRVIEVPALIHKNLLHSDGLPLFQMIAKNVGIRRARGEFILATNIDLLFSEELMSWIASCRLDRDCVYRIDRYDVKTSVLGESTLEHQLEFCRANVIRVARQWGTVPPGVPVSPGLSMLKPRWLAERYDALQERRLIPVRRRSRLHENACGDFTLMHRNKWIELRGYPEFKMYSMFIDGLLLHAALHAGVKQKVLDDPMRIYHIEHSEGSGWTPEGEYQLNARLHAKGVPQLKFAEYVALCTQMRRDRQPLIFNDVHWGLADEQLEEARPLRGVVASSPSARGNCAD
ncbi:MAG: hypothetical protein NVSMB52_12330 [Chloroflexota bacterium]